MLVRLMAAHPDMEYDGWDFDHADFVKATTIESYDQFIKFIDFIMEKDKDIKVDDDWYSVIDYAFSFPHDRESIPSLEVYVCEAY